MNKRTQEKDDKLLDLIGILSYRIDVIKKDIAADVHYIDGWSRYEIYTKLASKLKVKVKKEWDDYYAAGRETPQYRLWLQIGQEIKSGRKSNVKYLLSKNRELLDKALTGCYSIARPYYPDPLDHRFSEIAALQEKITSIKKAPSPYAQQTWIV